jgi:hypothetical protein
VQARLPFFSKQPQPSLHPVALFAASQAVKGLLDSSEVAVSDGLALQWLLATNERS